jgi:hypothetical protein
MASIEDKELMAEWKNLRKDWYSLYLWNRTSGHFYRERIAKWILDSFKEIESPEEKKGIRQSDFKQYEKDVKTPKHRGQLSEEQIDNIDKKDNSDDIKAGKNPLPFNEERFTRAIFNMGDDPVLGEKFGYEVPFQAPNANNKPKLTDIDLVCQTDDEILCIEAKNLRANPSVLKAILQAYFYTSLAVLRRKQFVKEFGLSEKLPLVPAILIGMKQESQLKELANGSNLCKLVRELNGELKGKQAGEFRYFVVTNSESNLTKCLRILRKRKPFEDIKRPEDMMVVFQGSPAFTPEIKRVVPDAMHPVTSHATK